MGHLSRCPVTLLSKVGSCLLQLEGLLWIELALAICVGAFI